LDQRKLGHTGISVAPFALGGNVFGWTADETTSFSILDAFSSSGFNLIDTADVYANWIPGLKGGESETILGKWLARSGKRDKIVLATKVGMEMGPGQKGLSKRYIIEAVEASLRRLNTDYIDLYQSHEDDRGTSVLPTIRRRDSKRVSRSAAAKACLHIRRSNRITTFTIGPNSKVRLGVFARSTTSACSRTSHWPTAS
jgi:aryl-alcohol dehydrogenase-like predicted oxidoreductase